MYSVIWQGLRIVFFIKDQVLLQIVWCDYDNDVIVRFDLRFRVALFVYVFWPECQWYMIHCYIVCLSSLDRTDKREDTNEMLYSAVLMD